MKPFRHWTLYQRLLLLGTAPAVGMFIILLAFFTSARLNDARDDLFRTSQIIANNLAPAAEYPVVSGNRDALRQLLDKTLKRSDLAWIRVHDVMGETVGEVQNATASTVVPSCIPSLRRLSSSLSVPRMRASSTGSNRITHSLPAATA